MSKTAKAMVSYHRAATMTITCPVCHVPPGRHCPSRRKAAERQTHTQRVIAWEKQVAINQIPKKEQRQ